MGASLGDRCNAYAIDIACSCLDDPFGDVRCAVLQALPKVAVIDEARAVSGALAHARHPEGYVRCSAIQALAILLKEQDRGACTAVLPFLADEQWDVRWWVLKILARVAPPDCEVVRQALEKRQ